MPDLTFVYDFISVILPFDCMQVRFMQKALFGLILLAPMTAAMGVQVINFRMAFFSDAVSHSAFAGAAMALIFSTNPHWTMPVFGLMVGLGIMAMQRGSALSSDTIIGVFFSAVIAFGLAVVSRDRSAARNLQNFLYGDILTITDMDINCLVALFVILILFQTWGYNRMIYIGLNATLAETHQVRVAAYQYAFAGLLSLVVIFAVYAVGVLLVTAMLIVPAAAARNLARSSGGMFWWALLAAVFSAVGGLIVSAQEWARTASGATIILIASLWFVVSAGISHFQNRRTP